MRRVFQGHDGITYEGVYDRLILINPPPPSGPDSLIFVSRP